MMMMIQWRSKSSDDLDLMMIEWCSRSSNDPEFMMIQWCSRSSDDPDSMMIQWWSKLDEDDLTMKMTWRWRWIEDEYGLKMKMTWIWIWLDVDLDGTSKKTCANILCRENTFLVKRECWCICNFGMYTLVYLMYCTPMFILGSICNVIESCDASMFLSGDSIM